MVDWFKVLTELQRCGLDLRSTSRATGVRYWRMYRVYRQQHLNVDLYHDEGEKLLGYWCTETHRDKDQAPKLRICN